jgi:hypothetical protein
MKKFKLLLIVGFLIFTMIGCNAEIDDIDFYLNSGIDTIEVNSVYVDPGATAKVFGLRRSNEVIENTVDATQVGVYHITYSFVYQEFEMALTRIVTVIDETPPVLVLNPGLDTIRINSTWSDASFSYYDNSENNLIFEITGFVDTSKTGTYVISYKATDESGNSSTIYRYVNVIE